MRLKLNEIEREKRPEPFSVELSNGSEVEFVDPKRLHWSKLADLQELGQLDQVKTVVSPDGFQALRDDPTIDLEMLESIMLAYQEHFGLGDPGKSVPSTSS
jgi:hypothetical protein